MTEQTLAVREFQGAQIPAPGTFKLDVAHSTVGFVVKHMMFSKVRGHFTDYSGTIVVAANPLDSSVDVTINVASIHTGNGDRDNHLRTGDFFETDKFPEATFKSTGLRHLGGQEFLATGDLTLRGVTKSVDLRFEITGAGTNPWGQEVFGIAASTEIDREAWGLTWNTALESGGVLVGKIVKIEIEAEAIREA